MTPENALSHGPRENDADRNRREVEVATGMVDLAVVAWIATSWRALLALDGSTLAVLGALLSSLAVMVGYWTG